MTFPTVQFASLRDSYYVIIILHVCKQLSITYTISLILQFKHHILPHMLPPAYHLQMLARSGVAWTRSSRDWQISPAQPMQQSTGMVVEIQLSMFNLSIGGSFLLSFFFLCSFGWPLHCLVGCWLNYALQENIFFQTFLKLFGP